jgi:outer membrane murein-binding lipoprotein Lpp
MPGWLCMATSTWTWIGPRMSTTRGSASRGHGPSAQRQRALKHTSCHQHGVYTASTKVVDLEGEMNDSTADMDNLATDVSNLAREVANPATDVANREKEVPNLATESAKTTTKTHATHTPHAWTRCTCEVSQTRPPKCWRTRPLTTTSSDYNQDRWRPQTLYKTQAAEFQGHLPRHT